MEKPREARSKADAIRAFLENHQPKLPEARGFLQFLLAKEEILRHLELVSDLTDCPDAILISAKGAGTWPFFYRKGDRYFHKTSQAVVELMRFVPERIFLCLSTTPPAWSVERQEFLDTLSRWHDELFTDEVDRLTRRQSLLARIDEALANGDRGSFDELTERLRDLEP
ncbi:MAG TPA: YpiB family protein [Symbiobacteriaceae bacterium]|nr:YpiB family protein [Symbiobacteriaceae bacterium]